MIGWDNGDFKIKGGRATYEAVMFNCAGRQTKVLLARLESDLSQTNRYVDWDTELEFPESEEMTKWITFNSFEEANLSQEMDNLPR